MSQYKLLILSDLHIGQASEANNSTRLTIETPEIPIHDNPFESLKDFYKDEKIHFDGIINLGDLANRGLISGHNLGMKMLRDLSLRYQCPLINTPGNHDYCYNFAKGPQLYLKSIVDYPTDNGESNSDFWSKGFCLYKLNGLNVLICNSAKDYKTVEDKDNVPVFDELYCNDLRNYLKEKLHEGINIAIVHHHVLQHSDIIESADYDSNDIIDHADNFLSLIKEFGFCCVLHGHKHLSRFTTHNGMAIMACGSLSALENVRKCDEKNYFHVLTISDDEQIKGVIESYYFKAKKGWLEIVDNNFSIRGKYSFGYTFNFDTLADKIASYIDDKTPCMEVANYEEQIPELSLLSEEDKNRLSGSLDNRGIKYMLSGKSAVIWKIR